MNREEHLEKIKEADTAYYDNADNKFWKTFWRPHIVTLALISTFCDIAKTVFGK